VYPHWTVELTFPITSVHTGSVCSSLGKTSRPVAEHIEFCPRGTEPCNWVQQFAATRSLREHTVSSAFTASECVAEEELLSTRPEFRIMPARCWIRASAILREARIPPGYIGV
jgi:hypothetical protein